MVISTYTEKLNIGQHESHCQTGGELS